ncbi:hypothetical protein [uncultured Erythrobacter sp.]|uniref:hypothetical protein n=1 Tax=uncultured Erythrobacter sp. TaxID=263913 RepID=UPI0026115E60|nr:hypothetical protein [uncultured Erythrobacter sp.]
MLTRLVTTSALITAAIAPAALSAQQERTSPVPRYDLMQLSVETAEVLPADFKAKTEALRSCNDAKNLGKALDAKVTRNRFVRASALPDEVQDLLTEIQVGQATPVFSADGTVMRVLVLCSRA